MNSNSNKINSFWSKTKEEIFNLLGTKDSGLTTSEASDRIKKYGENKITKSKKSKPFDVFIKQFKSPITLILLFATVISISLRDYTDSIIILSIVLISGFLGFFQEYNAGNAVNKLMDIVKVKADVIRDGQIVQIPTEELVPGDIVKLHTGDIIPGDCLILESNGLSVDESTLTGETFPVEKNTNTLEEATSLSTRINSLWMGTHVVGGEGTALIVNTGLNTEFGEISGRLEEAIPLTDFEIGVRKFGTLLMELTVLMLLGIFAVNLVLKKPVFDSFLFSLALAVGLTPQLLPAIISVNLSTGAKKMAEKKVIVKKLSSIENFGSMDTLCTDKTGTITTGIIKLHEITDYKGNNIEELNLYAYLNASFQSGYENPIDDAIMKDKAMDVSSYKKISEIPYNFKDKTISVIVDDSANKPLLIMKGALENVLSKCTTVKSNGDILPLNDSIEEIRSKYSDLGQGGYRVLGLAISDSPKKTGDDYVNEELTFLGFIILNDPLKEDSKSTIDEIRKLGVDMKIITGDNRYVAKSVAESLGLNSDTILTGGEISRLNDEALIVRVKDVSLFAEIEPNQKDRIITSLQKGGSVVGYMGDGINDATAIKSADVGISVNTAADVAKAAADIVLLENNLQVLIAGVLEGRKTFLNTMKYVHMATSANFGNMFSMAGASTFLPFLPLLPTQVLLTNLVTDFPEMQIANDNVEETQLEKPRKWDINFIKKYMITFGLLSSIFDYLTFGVLIFVFKASESLFQTGWFTESVISAASMVLILRTEDSIFKSKPAKGLLIATMLSIAFTLALPYTPLGSILKLVPLPPTMILTLGLLVVVYLTLGEILKINFYKKHKGE